MPKLYEYFGLAIIFYSNEHEPVHVHGKCQGRESRADIIIINGAVDNIRFQAVRGRPPLSNSEMQFFREIVTVRANDIVSKWIDYFVLHKAVQTERITRRLK